MKEAVMPDATIEFTDRYGGRMPSWLRRCRGECEATGVVPLYREGYSTSDLVFEAPPLDEYQVAAWQNAHAASSHKCDGWHFVKCWDCDGSGRSPWWVAVARVPLWLGRGIPFVWHATRTASMWPPGLSVWGRFRVSMWAAYGAEIMRLYRRR